MMSEIRIKPPNKNTIMPPHAIEQVDRYEVSDMLLASIERAIKDNGITLHAMFNEDVERLVKVLELELEGQFIYDMLNTEFGRGVLVGYVLRCYSEQDYELFEEEDQDA